VHLSDGLRLQISEVCSLLDVDGIRGDITVNKAAAAFAALEGRAEVTPADVQRIIALCLNHRRAPGRRVRLLGLARAPWERGGCVAEQCADAADQADHACLPAVRECEVWRHDLPHPGACCTMLVCTDTSKRYCGWACVDRAAGCQGVAPPMAPSECCVMS